MGFHSPQWSFLTFPGLYIKRNPVEPINRASCLYQHVINWQVFSAGNPDPTQVHRHPFEVHYPWDTCFLHCILLDWAHLSTCSQRKSSSASGFLVTYSETIHCYQYVISVTALKHVHFLEKFSSEFPWNLDIKQKINNTSRFK